MSRSTPRPEAAADDPRYYVAVKERTDGKRAALLRGPQDPPPGHSHPGRARRRRARRRLSAAPGSLIMVAIATRPARTAGRSRTHPMGHNRGQLLPVRCQPLPGPASQGHADGLHRLSGRIPAGGRTPNRSSCRRARHAPAGLGKPGCPRRPASRHGAGHPVPGKKGVRQPPNPPTTPAVRSLAPGRPSSAPRQPRQGRLRRRKRALRAP